MKISYGNSRFETKWKNSEITWEDFKKTGILHNPHNRDY